MDRAFRFDGFPPMGKPSAQLQHEDQTFRRSSELPLGHPSRRDIFLDNSGLSARVDRRRSRGCKPENTYQQNASTSIWRARVLTSILYTHNSSIFVARLTRSPIMTALSLRTLEWNRGAPSHAPLVFAKSSNQSSSTLKLFNELTRFHARINWLWNERQLCVSSSPGNYNYEDVISLPETVFNFFE